MNIDHKLFTEQEFELLKRADQLNADVQKEFMFIGDWALGPICSRSFEFKYKEVHHELKKILSDGHIPPKLLQKLNKLL